MKVMMITMIVTEIITTLSNTVHSHGFLVGLFSGGLSSLFVTISFWWVISRLFAPCLEISRDIAYEIVDEEREQKDGNGVTSKDEKGTPIMIPYKAYVYRIKLANVSIRGAFDIKIFFRLRYENHYATIELPYQPYLKGRKNILVRWKNKKKKIEETYEHHRTIPFRLTDIRLSKIEGYNKPELKQKHADGVLNLNDFKKEDTIVEFVVMAVDSLSGSALRTVSKRFTQNDLDKHVKKGKFLDGEMEIRSTIQTSDG